MKLKEAMKIIKAGETKPKRKKSEMGFMIGFEKAKGGILASGNFPDKHAGEKLIKTEAQAWKLAKRFADSTDDSYVNIYVKDQDFSPVKGYEGKKLKKYPC